MDILEKLRNKLIVSCQALEDEPLHSPYIMSKMALAAKQGGASGIRANTVQDIQAIKQEVDLPIIGIIKKDFTNSRVFITPTIHEVDELYREGVDIIAFDATGQERPDDKSFKEFFSDIKAKYPDQLFMADISTFEEGINAEKMGVDIVATTLAGYTPYSKDAVPMNLVTELIEHLSVPVIAEGNFDSPEKGKKALQSGAHSVVVGSAITRPQLITEKFSQAVVELANNSTERRVIE
ncbi:N-acetylmannosamine-6-phosphate 2-epimerase [Lentibacillus amyloliquefaciens]|uniref:Putative N-acetylmannosamine-6-phosphate 2-epimerase n=1 Tax=Lentibacillus amyloliquefaciens TaxID=1472767 RepID=A0A0U4FQJ7_9BACI|nr:N-acetylmannosamine-6-phosphate 2-epimerase [Lentibacillus amyloliquefaciens]ALX49972.1 N-acetylmannosamine-6-phosphate 2-epimerase [Lentibacillus amyloliquefaciens]